MKNWITQSGQKLRVVDMETSHIKNCIRMLEKKLEDDPGEQYYTGDSDYAEDAVEQENRANREIREKIDEALSSFKEELRYRKMGKPIGEEPFATGVIEKWELPPVEED